MQNRDVAPVAGARLLLVLSALAIAVATLTPLPGGRSSTGLCILCGDLGASDFLSNIILFAPLGFALGLRDQPFRRALLIGFLVSLSVEVAQLTIISGRDSSIGDLTANTLGTMVGWTLGFHRSWWLRRDHDMRRCVMVTIVTLAVLLGGLALFTPSLPESTWFLQWNMRLRGTSAYEGRVLTTRIGHIELEGRGRIEHSDSVRGMLLTQPIEFTATAARPRRRTAPIVTISDERRRRVMLLGAVGTDLVYHHRVLASELRFNRGDVRVPRVFEGLQPGDTYTLSWSADGGGYCVDVNDRRTCVRGLSVGDTWTLLQAPNLNTDGRRAMRILWLWLAFVPAGILAARARTVIAAGVVVVLALTIVPPLLGFAITPLYQLAAAVAGLVSGATFARYMTTRPIMVSESSAPA